jgi:hypothetical protein
MADQRIKGQEVQVLITSGGAPQSTITDIRSFEVGFQTEILREGYLGETTDRRDEVFRGVRGRIEFHFENQDVLRLIQSILDRAQRREPGLVINVKATLNFPNGQNPKVVINNVFFGEQPINFAGRTEYGTFGLEFEAENGRFLLA